MRYRIISFIVLVVTATASWFAYRAINAALLPAYDASFLATTLLASVLIHELGHWVVMENYGIRSHVFIAVLLGGASPHPDSIKKFKRLPWSQEAAIALAGVMGNVLVVVIGVMLNAIGMLSQQEMLIVASVNGGLIFFNLLPVSMLDGRRFASALFNSVPERLDRTFARVIWYAVCMGIVVVTISTPEHFFFTPIILGWGMNKQANNDDPNGSTSPRAMSASEQKMWAATYSVLMIFGITLVGLTHGVMK